MTALPANRHVAIIGAGMSGLFMAHRLQEQGIAFTVYEKAHEVGGTWRENKYPGLYVDVPTSKFHFSFAPKHDWTHAFAPGPEIQQYLVGVADDFDIRRHIRFGVTITNADWQGSFWTLTTGDDEVIEVQAVVFATGFLHRALVPSLPGQAGFAGVQFHSSQWPDGLEIEGKRIAIVGSGSSGIQLVSELGVRGEDVTQFVRHPQWIETCQNPESTEEWRAATRASLDGRTELVRFEEGIEQDPRLRDPYWKLVPGKIREDAVAALREQITVIRDPELRESLTPDYLPGCKRIPKSPHYYQAVQLPNVSIVRDGVTSLDSTGLIDSHGTHHDADIVVWATGFDTHAYMRPIRVTGADGIELDEVWGRTPFSYRGVSVPGFPNMFMLHGPYSPVNNVPVPTTLDDETRYVAARIGQIERERVAIAPSAEATSRFLALMAEYIPATVWAQDCDNWYRIGNSLPIIWPWYEVEHAAMFNEPSDGDLDTQPLAQTVGATSD
jgi:cation diffusion facilitator CzcD-associated flavoprotein CzcO